MKRIPLTRDAFTIVDDADFEALSKWKWHLRAGRYAGRRLTYAESTERPTPLISLARFLLKAPAGQVVDHINGNTLDDRRANLRVCSQRNNSRNKKLHKGHRFKGIYLRGGKWVAKINLPEQKILGTFETPEEAARAYDAAARKHFGEFARLNFP